MQKVADASGAKYSAGSAPSPGTGGAPPPIKSKPVFTPTSSSAARNPLVAARSRRDQNVDEDGWGDDAPPVTRSQLEKVDSAYKPTKVNIGNLSQQSEPSRFTPNARANEPKPDIIGGSYQPVGKVDIAAIRAQAKNKQDDRPTIVKGAYEPVGKVDIAAIRAKAQKPTPEPQQQQQQEEEPEAPKPLSERAAAFSQPAASERLTSLPKPKVANKFGGASSFTGTKAPLPGSAGLTGPGAPTSTVPVAGTSRTFADEGGKTPAQIWAEKKARERGSDVGVPAPATTTASIPVQKSGEWKSGYSGKSWAPVQTSGYGQQAQGEVVSEHGTGNDQQAEEHEDDHTDVSALRDRFKNSAPISAGAPPVPRATHDSARDVEEEQAPPPPPPSGSRPSGGFALPGLPTRPPPPTEEEEEEDPSAYEQTHEREESPIRVAQPVSHAHEPSPEPEPEPEPEPVRAPVPPPPAPVEEPQYEQHEEEPAHAAGGGDIRAVVIYDYTKDEDNEVELVEGQMVTNIEQVDPDWWMGTNHLGEHGLFPSAYVEVIEEDDGGAEPEQHAAPPPPAPAERAVPAAPAAASGPSATALYDYEAAEDNGKFCHTGVYHE